MLWAHWLVRFRILFGHNHHEAPLLLSLGLEPTTILMPILLLALDPWADCVFLGAVLPECTSSNLRMCFLQASRTSKEPGQTARSPSKKPLAKGDWFASSENSGNQGMRREARPHATNIRSLAPTFRIQDGFVAAP